jgi:hypothetical protein
MRVGQALGPPPSEQVDPDAARNSSPCRHRVQRCRLAAPVSERTHGITSDRVHQPHVRFPDDPCALRTSPRSGPREEAGPAGWGAQGAFATARLRHEINAPALGDREGLDRAVAERLMAHPETEGERRWGPGGRGPSGRGQGSHLQEHEGRGRSAPRNTPRPPRNHDLRLRHCGAAAQRRRLLTLGLTRDAGTWVTIGAIPPTAWPDRGLSPPPPGRSSDRPGRDVEHLRVEITHDDPAGDLAEAFIAVARVVA